MHIKTHPFISGFVIAMAMAIFYIILTMILHINTENPFIEELFKKLITTITITIIFCILRKKGVIASTKLKLNLWKGLKDGWLFLLIGTINIFSFSTNGAHFRPWSHIICFIVSIMLTGFWEEMLFRGTILNLCKKNYVAQHRIKQILPIIFSSFIFSLFHLLNVSSGEVTISRIVIQMISVFFTGIYYGAIYTRSSNILALIMLHTFQDITALLKTGLLQDSGDISDAISALSPELALASFVFIIPATWPTIKKWLVSNQKNN